MPDRVGGGSVAYDPGDQRVVVEISHHHRAGLVRYQKLKSEGRPARMCPQSGRPGWFVEIAVDVVRVREALGRVHRRRRVPEPSEDLARLGGQHLRRHEADLVDPATGRRGPGRAAGPPRPPRGADRRARREAGRLAGGGHHLGDGVSPAASAAARGRRRAARRPPRSADAGRCAGSRSRQRRIARSTAGSRSRTRFDGLGGRRSLRLRVSSASVLPSKACLPVKIS